MTALCEKRQNTDCYTVKIFPWPIS